MTSYPDSVPLEEFKTVVNIVKNNQVVEQRASFAHALWVVQGYAQSKLLGEPVPTFISTQSAEGCCGGGCSASLDQAVCEMEKVVASAEGDVAAQAIINWKLILDFAIKQLLAYLLS